MLIKKFFSDMSKMLKNLFDLAQAKQPYESVNITLDLMDIDRYQNNF